MTWTLAQREWTTPPMMIYVYVVGDPVLTLIDGSYRSAAGRTASAPRDSRASGSRVRMSRIAAIPASGREDRC